MEVLHGISMSKCLLGDCIWYLEIVALEVTHSAMQVGHMSFPFTYFIYKTVWPQQLLLI